MINPTTNTNLQNKLYDGYPEYNPKDAKSHLKKKNLIIKFSNRGIKNHVYFERDQKKKKKSMRNMANILVHPHGNHQPTLTIIAKAQAPTFDLTRNLACPNVNSRDHLAGPNSEPVTLARPA